MADFHFNAFAGINSAEICGITRDYYGSAAQREDQFNRLKEKASQLNIKLYENFDAIVEDPHIDALIIASVNNLHYPQIIKGIEHGKHLLVEKPVIIDPDQYNEIEQLAAEKKVVIFPAHNFAYRGAMRKAKEIIDSATLGKIIYSSFVSSHQISEAHANGWRALKDIGAGGALIDSGHHQVYQSLYLLGKPKKLHGFLSKMHHLHMEGEDTAVVNLQYEDGSVATIMQSWASGMDGGANAIRIIGTNGSLSISDSLYHNDKKISDETGYVHSVEALAEAFIDCLENGTPPVSSLQDSMDTLKLVYAAYKSAEKNIVVDF